MAGPGDARQFTTLAWRLCSIADPLTEDCYTRPLSGRASLNKPRRRTDVDDAGSRRRNPASTMATSVSKPRR